MPHHATAPRDGTVVASGYGLKLNVQRGHLVIHDGVCNDRRTRRYNRATSGIKRLVVIGTAGYVTFEALEWLRHVGAAFVHVNRYGQLVAVSALNGPNVAQLRRAQALAATSDAGVEIARLVLGEKLRSQQAVATHLHASGAATETIAAAIDQVEAAEEFDQLLAAEATAATAYWDMWAEVQVSFAPRGRQPPPEHWRTFGQRHSPLTRSPRQAATPANAILNYLYTLLEAETVLACLTVGLDPALGVFHTDKPARHSLALDLMEAARPAVDAYLLELLRERRFRASDFRETQRGACRITPLLARELAETLPVWRSHVAPTVEQVTQVLSTGPAPTSLTQSNRAAAWDGRRANANRRASVPALPPRCRDCGTPLDDRRRRICDPCRRERAVAVGATGRAIAADVLAELRGEGRDPAHGGQAAKERGEKNARHQHAVRVWNEQNQPMDPERFRREILPALKNSKVGELVAATGLSEHYCSLIRRGARVPHPRHWQALSRVGRRGASETWQGYASRGAASNLRP